MKIFYVYVCFGIGIALSLYCRFKINTQPWYIYVMIPVWVTILSLQFVIIVEMITAEI
jgi:hypothetical protein